ncbi:MAG: SEL1-like repeat protein [Synergistaceae bacterium]|nr:SEL1-like repeat protein [Synergistaceae bacterium]
MRRVCFATVLCLMFLTFSAFAEDFNVVMKRANLGNAEAQFQIGRMYANGDGVKQDYKLAASWYEKAAKRSHPAAQNNLGVLYHDGKGVKQDYKKARRLYEKAAAQNYGFAFGNLGWMYQHGQGVDVNYKKAFEYYIRGAAQGNARSLNQLGWFYEHGLGVEIDYGEAFKWYSKGANKGNDASMNNIANMYENGMGVAKDIKKAIALYRQSAEKGNENARAALVRLNASYMTTPTIQGNVAEGNDGYVSLNDDADVKPRMAVLAFEDRSEGKKANPKAIMNMVVTELHKKRSFALLERELIDDISKEANFEYSDTSTAVKIGKLKSAQYVMTGAITLYYYSENRPGSYSRFLEQKLRPKLLM